MNVADHEASSFWRSRGSAALLVVAVVGGFLLFAEHRSHILGYLPYVFLLACPLMHLFMHQGHRHRSGQDHNGGNNAWRIYAAEPPCYLPTFPGDARTQPVKAP